MSCECFRTLDGSWMDGERERKELTCYCCSPFFLSFPILNGYLSMTNVDYSAMRWTKQKLIKLKPEKVLDTNIRWVQTALPIELFSPEWKHTHIQQTTAYKIDQAVDLPRSNSHTTYSTQTVRGATINASDENARENVQQKTIWLFIFYLKCKQTSKLYPLWRITVASVAAAKAAAVAAASWWFFRACLLFSVSCEPSNEQGEHQMLSCTTKQIKCHQWKLKWKRATATTTTNSSSTSSCTLWVRGVCVICDGAIYCNLIWIPQF